MKKLLFTLLTMNLLLMGCSSTTAKQVSTIQSSSPSEEVSKEWKQTLDAYEAFYDEYVEFMKSYDSSTLDTETIDHYTELLKKFNTYSSELENVDEDSLSKADKEYFIEVNGRIQKKLLEVNN